MAGSDSPIHLYNNRLIVHTRYPPLRAPGKEGGSKETGRDQSPSVQQLE